MEVDWQNNFHQIKDRGQHLLQTEKWADCRFLVGRAPGNRLFSGHKLILAMASPVFERMFYGNLREDDDANPIIIPDVQPDAFQAMLEYIYTDHINISSFDKACELCYVAKKYMLPHVVVQCTQFLWRDSSPKNACRAYEFAKLFDEPRLMQSRMEIIQSKTCEVLRDPSFLDIEVSTLMAILDQDRLNIDSELDLFNALVRYASERGLFCEPQPAKPTAETAEQANETVEEIKMEPDVALMMNNIAEDSFEHVDPQPSASAEQDVLVVEASENEAAANEAPDFETLSTLMDAQRIIMDEGLLQQAVKKIRFLTLTPQQFAEGPARSKLLQQHEALAILIKISSPGSTDCPMPEGFSSERCTRISPEQRCQRSDLFNVQRYMPIFSNGSSCSTFAPIETQPHAANNATVYQPLPTAANTSGILPGGLSNSLLPGGATSNNHLAGGDAHDLMPHDARRYYCVRTANPQFDYRNASVTDCGLTFQVDMNVWITGVQVPTQVLSGELMNSAGFSERYTEILYAHIQDMQGSRLSYTHCTARVRYDSVLEVSFDRPVYVYRHQTYKVYVVFNKVGWYPMYSCLPDVTCNRVKFMFNVSNPNESLRDGLIRAIVFSPPQEHYPF